MKLLQKLARRHNWLGLGRITSGLLMTDFDRSDVARGVMAADLCYNCGAREGKMKLCSRCRTAKYCNRACQHQDWFDHRVVCEGLKQRNASGVLVAHVSVLGLWEW